MNSLHLPDAIRYRSLDSAALRQAFVADRLFVPGTVQLLATDIDRQILGGAVPLHDTLPLPTPDALRARHFCERRELGIINVGGAGRVTVDGKDFRVGERECVYAGRGSQRVSFTSDDASCPAAFFLVSFPAHQSHPTRHASLDEARVVALGSAAQANVRRIHQFIHPEGITSCQLVMGFTEIDPGSVWNTMPPHTHDRRCETYLYFDLPDAQRVVHVLGTPDETRHVIVGNREAVIAPSWSLHFGVGTHSYRFVWAMGGENQSFDDMDAVALAALR